MSNNNIVIVNNTNSATILSTNPTIFLSSISFSSSSSSLSSSLRHHSNESAPDDFEDHQKSATSLICFTVSLLSIISHTILVPLFASLRKLYGIDLFMTLITMAIFYTFMLVGAFLNCRNELTPRFACKIIGMITHVIMLVIPSSILIATILLWSRIRIGKLVHIVNWKMNCAYLTSILLPPLLFFILSLISHQMLPYEHLLNPRYGGVNCAVGCIENHLLFIFTPSTIMYGIQFVFLLLITRLRFSTLSTVGQSEAACQPDNEARLLICWKLGVSNFLIMLCTFGANTGCSAMMWHLFTILSTMQCIYIVINLSFSRPFLMVLFHQSESKLHMKLSNSLALNKGKSLPHDATQNTLI